MTAPHSSSPSSSLSRWLASNQAYLTLFAAVAAFGAYSSMYAFRKPFTAATFSKLTYAGFDYKVLLVLAQTIGYALSKFIGIKVVSEITPKQRVWAILGLIGIAEGALILFPLIPRPWNVACLFVNGLPLGMIWGLVFGFLEGRRVSDLLGLGLSISFIVSSGVMKTVGSLTMRDWGVSEFWMPALTGALFTPLLLLCVWMLSQLPPPSEEDIAARAKRVPMNSARRWQFVRDFSVGLTLLIGAYVILSVYRDLRDTFMVEILRDLKAIEDPKIFAAIETRVGLCVLVLLAFFWNLKDSRKALFTYSAIISLGAILVGASTWAFQSGWVTPFWWMFFTGLGSYLAYVPYNSVLFDRLLAAFKQSGTSSFLITTADSFGYLSSVGLYVYRTLLKGSASWLNFLTYGSYVIAFAIPACLLLSSLYLQRKQIEVK